MATTLHLTDVTVDLARMTRRSRDRARELAHQHRELPNYSAALLGQADAFELVLAYVAGYTGHRSVIALERELDRLETRERARRQSWTESEMRLSYGDR